MIRFFEVEVSFNYCGGDGTKLVMVEDVDLSKDESFIRQCDDAASDRAYDLFGCGIDDFVDESDEEEGLEELQANVSIEEFEVETVEDLKTVLETAVSLEKFLIDFWE